MSEEVIYFQKYNMADRVRDLEKAKDAWDRKSSLESIVAHKMKVNNGTDTGEDNDEGGHSTAGPYLKSLVFGGLDGTVTTFTLVCASIGGNFSTGTLVVMGVAKVLSDAISMGLGDTVSEMAEYSFVTAEREREQWEMQNFLEGEMDEMVELYVQKGFKEADARKILHLMVQKNPDFFLDHMLVQELGLMPPDEDDNPVKKGLVMFTSFCLCGMLVLFPFVILENETSGNGAYILSIFVSIAVLATLGATKASFTKQNRALSAVQYVLIGGLSACTAYMISSAMKSFVK